MSLLSLKLGECFQKFLDYANRKNRSSSDGTGVEGGEAELLSCKKTAETNISKELEEAAKDERKANDFIDRASSAMPEKLKELEKAKKSRNSGH